MIETQKEIANAEETKQDMQAMWMGVDPQSHKPQTVPQVPQLRLEPETFTTASIREQNNPMTKTYTDADLIECATNFIHARRKKLDAKAARSKLLSQCEVVHAFDGNCAESPCWMDPDNRGDWCDKCKASRPYHKAFIHFSGVAGNALRKMERIVNHRRDAK